MKSKRLLCVAHLIEKHKRGEVLADIGSDHGYLPIYLVENNIIDKAYACEIAQGPLNASIENIKQHHLENRVIPLLGSGMNPIIDKDIDMISICGMGGILITEILDEYPLRDCIYFLQANTAIDVLRHYLNDHHLKIIDEDIVEDGHHIYEVIVCVKGDQILNEDDYIFGPVLRKKGHTGRAQFIKKWNWELSIQYKILNSLSIDHPKYAETMNTIRKIEGELNESK